MDAVDLLFFGGTGDLAMRKLLPALYNLDRDGVLDEVEPVLQAWEHDGSGPKPYAAGTWGPAAADALIDREITAWPEAL